MKKLNILHIASFNGNIGDNANHNGLYRKLKLELKKEIHITNIEIRNFYKSWNIQSFDDELFIEKSNNNDLVIIGGGNFFELNWDYSNTGTTIDIKNSTIEKIKTPILFYGLGFDLSKGASKEAILKFYNFLSYITKKPNILVSFRNDGSIENLYNLYGSFFEDKVLKILDGAFYFVPEEKNTILDQMMLLSNERKYIGINLVSDMKEIRFNRKENSISYTQFMNELATIINEFLDENPDYDVILFPHIYSDLEAFSQFLNFIEDSKRRFRFLVAPYLTGSGAENVIFNLYKKCNLILGMRFHSNICAFVNNIPTIALSSYKKINDLYKDIKLSSRVCQVNMVGFSKTLRLLLQDTLINNDEIKSLYLKKYSDLKFKNKINFDKIIDWINFVTN